MVVSTGAASPWPARAAWLSATICTCASGATNVAYGWQKGSDLPGQLTWAAVAGAVAIIFALSWPALIRSLEARRWSAALMALAALLLAGAYSVTAALGSAAGGRTNAATAEKAATGTEKRTQAAYDAAKGELGALKPSRPVAELEALVANARPVCRVIVTQGHRDTFCAQPPALVAELGRAKRRAELEGKIERTATELAKAGPVKSANSDAAALQRYLAAVGVELAADRLNDLLVLLAVLMIEAGGGLSLALGMALSAPVVQRGRAHAGVVAETPIHTGAVLKHFRDGAFCPERHLAARSVPRVPRASQSAEPECAQTLPLSTIVEWLTLQGGRSETSMRRLAKHLGRSASGVHREMRGLLASGAITMSTGPRGTFLALRPN